MSTKTFGDSAEKNRINVAEGKMHAKIYVLNTSLQTIEEHIISDKQEVAWIAGLKERENSGSEVQIMLDANLWNGKTEEAKEINFIEVVATKSTNHHIKNEGVVIKCPDGETYILFGTVLIMNMNPATGDLQNVELSFKEIDDAVSFFRFKNKTDLANRLLGF